MNPSYFKDNVNDMKRVWRHTGFSSGVRNFSLVGSGVSLDHLNHFPRGCAPREMIEMVLGDSLPTREKFIPPLEKSGASLLFSCHYINSNDEQLYFSLHFWTGLFWWPNATKLFKWYFWPTKRLCSTIGHKTKYPNSDAKNIFFLQVFVWVLFTGKRDHPR